MVQMNVTERKQLEAMNRKYTQLILLSRKKLQTRASPTQTGHENPGKTQLCGAGLRVRVLNGLLGCRCWSKDHTLSGQALSTGSAV